MLAVAALGLVGRGFGQEPRYFLPHGLAHPAAATTADVPPSVLPDEAHRSAMQVEVAWLADPVLFSYPLFIGVNGTGLVAHGYIPSPALRERALAVARTHSRLEIVDALNIHPGLAQRPGGQPAEAVQRAALAVLTGEFPDQVGAFRVTAAKDGRVTVAGSVRSHEDKWRVSRCLHRVRGCTSVENCLEPAGDGHPSATRAGPTSPPVADHWTAARQPAALVPQSCARDVAAPQPLPSPSAATSAPKAAEPATPQWVAPSAGPAPAGVAQANLPALPAGTPLYLRPIPGDPAPVETVQQQRPAPEPPQAPRPALAVPVVGHDQPPPAKAADTAARGPYVTTGVVLVRCDTPETPKPHCPPPKPALRRDTVRDPARPESAAGGSITTGTILVSEDRAKPPAQRPVESKAMPATVKAGAGHAPGGAALIPDDRPSPQRTVPATDETTQIQRRIGAACGPAARDLVVIRRAGDALEVHFKARNQAEADQLSAKIVVLPELLKYQLSFQVRVDP